MTTKDRTAIVTGASYGIGQATAIALAQDGYDLAITDLSTETLLKTKSMIEAIGRKVIVLSLDIREQHQIEFALSEVQKKLGPLHVLVNNAGLPSLRKKAIEISREEWQSIVDVNLTGTFFMTTSFGKTLIKENLTGCVVHIGSTHGMVGFEGASAYGITKAGLSHLAKMLAVEWAPFQIRVNVVAPGSTYTESRAPSFNDPIRKEQLLSRIPMHRFGRPEEVAHAVKYLASPEAAYITGQTLLLDGGLTAA